MKGTQRNTKKRSDSDWENVKIRRVLLNRLRSHKAKTHVPILKFVEIAITEKLDVETKIA